MRHSTAYALTIAATAALAALAACGDSTGSGGEGGQGGGVELYCGDGFTDPDLGEECDDGDFDDADQCLTDCTLAKCGDGKVQAGVEDCDDQNQDDTDACLSGCLAASCGDGFIQAGVEDCDDGNEEDGDACTSSCTAGAGCGNGTVEGAEDCDDGNQSSQDDCIDCVAAACGDGHAQVGVEDCDDGNQADDDSCSNTCVINVPETFGCPGTAVDVDANSSATLGGDTALATNENQGSCGGDESPEVVYAVTTLEAGTVTFEMVALADDLDPVLYVKSSCDGSSTLACADASFAGGYESVTVPAEAGETFYVFADGWGGSTGAYLIGATLLSTVPGDDCPGVNVPITDYNDSIPVSGNTSLAEADRQGTGLCASPATNEVVYRVLAPLDGTLEIIVDPSYDASVYVRTSCSTASSQVVCAEDGLAGELEIASIPVLAGNAYYVFIDGWDGDAGSFTADFTLVP
ncbi:MAG: hypothetical protein IPM79_14485 [Polyangiaceae bacterium]|jgi:cysteine-rich repeat protein|nr:hypothetical protein [Polyangiaceae bacterium]MBK8938793.1 hypothetical protein [Polyangiaceae bacterium]